MATQSYKINKINPNICYIKRLEILLFYSLNILENKLIFLIVLKNI